MNRILEFKPNMKIYQSYANLPKVVINGSSFLIDSRRVRNSAWLDIRRKRLRLLRGRRSARTGMKLHTSRQWRRQAYRSGLGGTEAHCAHARRGRGRWIATRTSDERAGWRERACNIRRMRGCRRTVVRRGRWRWRRVRRVCICSSSLRGC